ncbi:MAG: SDR family oxidoreductase [Gammaproteobacteria bacterium]|nr:SDR family oxidoreductase [Gammaproteobacteria bacterium]
MTSPVGIVFGGSKGIGAATAKALAACGTKVAIVARHQSACDEVAQDIAAKGGTALPLACNVAAGDQVKAAIKAAVDKFGRLDFVVNSAGVMDPIGLIENCPPDAWAHCLEVNITGSYHACRAALPIFRAQDCGVIVNLSSGAAFHALEGWGAYCVAKAGLVMLTRVLAAEVAGSGIRVYGFQPGMVNTGLTRDALRHKINRVADLDYAAFDPPEAPAAAIVWLCLHCPNDLSGGEVLFTDPAFQARLDNKSKRNRSSECVT